MNTLHGSWVGNACRITAAVLVSASVACAMPGAQDAPVAAEQYHAVVANPIRTERDRGMDERRHPVELLQFAQVRPGMHVLDIATGGGYTSQLLALAVGPTGKLWAQTPQPGATLK